MSEEPFNIVFEKLAEIASDEEGDALVAEVDKLANELDEIAELRRLAAVLADPESGSYTST